MTAATATKFSRLAYNESVPASWVFKGQLSRSIVKTSAYETFDFYLLPDGTVAQVTSHPMNDERFVDIKSADEQRARWQELLAGEKWGQSKYCGYGRYTRKQGRYPKAVRTK